MADVGRRNLNWEWDEIVLACDLVAQNGWRQVDDSSPKVAELSELLQRMTLHPKESRPSNFRSKGSVARKTADIATWHPDYQGKRTNGNRLDREVMAEFIAKPDAMRALAESIRGSAATGGMTVGELVMRLTSSTLTRQRTSPPSISPSRFCGPSAGRPRASREWPGGT